MAKKHGLGGRRNPAYKHGGRGTKLYQMWKAMRWRCKHHSDRRKWYAARGIDVCGEWNDFVSFRKWCLANGWRPGLEIDRRDNSRGYSPDNCRFVTHAGNAQNRTSTKLTRKIVVEIRSLLAAGHGCRELAVKFKVTSMSIWRIKTNRTWKGVVS